MQSTNEELKKCKEEKSQVEQQLKKCHKEKSRLELQLQSANEELEKCKEEKSTMENQLNEHLANCRKEKSALEQQLHSSNEELEKCNTKKSEVEKELQEHLIASAQMKIDLEQKIELELRGIETALGAHRIELANEFGPLAARKNEYDKTKKAKQRSLSDRVAADLGDLLGEAQACLLEAQRLGQLEQELQQMTAHRDVLATHVLEKQQQKPAQLDQGDDLRQAISQRDGRLIESARFCRALVRFFWAVADLNLFALVIAFAMPFFSLVPLCFIGLFWIGLAAALLFSAFACFSNFRMKVQTEIKELNIELLEQDTAQRSHLGGALRLLLLCVILLALANLIFESDQQLT